MATKPKIKNLPLMIQRARLMRCFADSKSSVKRSCLIWRGRLKPSPLSKTYLVELTYRLKENPKVHVMEPELVLSAGRKALPHVFSDNSLCLYRRHEWRGNMRIDETIIPWICEWLLHYEIWLATGSWCGGGVHPAGSKTAA